MGLDCGFWIFDGFSNMVLASAIEPLRAARDYAGSNVFTWQLLSSDGRDVTSSSGVALRCDCKPADIAALDILFVVAGYGARGHARPSIVKSLQLLKRRIPTLGALDSGAWILAAAGLLDGYKATVHWQDINQFEEVHLRVDVVNERYVIDRNRITAGGATTVIDLMLRLIADQVGGALAFDVSNMFAYDPRPGLRNELGARSLTLTSRAPQIINAVAAMRTNIEKPLNLGTLALATAVSPRTLARLFQREFGVGPGHYYQSIRLDVARSLVEETSLAVSEIAARTGFASVSSLSRAFANHFGSTVRHVRGNRRGTSRI
jgi:transcriptional regulator GlxA family with amidase domain